MATILAPSEWELLGRVALAAACGAAIGFERELVEKPAGLRTHALVALGAAAFTVAGFAGLSLVSPNSGVSTDPARIAAQVVNGIGFLGAGIVIFHGDRVRGITTAAEMWAVAAIGVLSGLGLLLVAGASTMMILAIVVGGRPVETIIDRIRVRRERSSRVRELTEERNAQDLADEEMDLAGQLTSRSFEDIRSH